MTRIMIGLSVEYVFIALGFAVVKDWARCGYFLAATVLNITVLVMR
jgi:hypothetical protein